MCMYIYIYIYILLALHRTSLHHSLGVVEDQREVVAGQDVLPLCELLLLLSL